MKKDILIYFDLITALKTTQDVANLASEIDAFMMEKTLDSISLSTAQKIREIFSKNNLDINDKDAVEGFFDTLKKLIKKFSVIKLALPFDPSYKTIENIHNFVKDTVGIGYILDIEVSQDLLGGAIVMFNGKYSDFTLKKTIEEAFANKNTKILELMQ